MDSWCYDISNTQFETTLIIDVTARMFQVILFGLIIILLLIFLRKKAIDNPAKRFGLSVIFTFSLASISVIVIELYPLVLCRRGFVQSQ